MAMLVADDEAPSQCWWQRMKQMAMRVADDEADGNAGGVADDESRWQCGR